MIYDSIIIGLVILGVQAGYIVGVFNGKYKEEIAKLTIGEGVLLGLLTIIWPISLLMGWLKLCEDVLESKKEIDRCGIKCFRFWGL